MSALGIIVGLLLLLILAMQLWRWSDHRAAITAWTRLSAPAGRQVEAFDPAMIAGLPEAAQRYFQFAIAPGTPLHTISEIRMGGEFGLGDREAPGYQPMRARQILSMPYGFLWILDEAGTGAMRISGSDALVGNRSWTRFWLLSSVPVVRAGNDADHLRSAFGRVVAEAAFWAPASLLPQNGVRREDDDSPSRARAIVTRGSLEQLLEIEVAEDGRPLWVKIPRWSNANPEGVWQTQPFGGTLEEFREFGGFTLPTRVDGGNHFGTADYFPFFRARVEDITFITRQPLQ